MQRWSWAAIALACAALAACGGGGGGGGTNITPLPTDTPIPPSGPSFSTTFTPSSTATSVPFTSTGGFTGAINLPAISGSGSVTLATYAAVPSGVPVLNIRSRQARLSNTAAANSALIYFTLTPSGTISLQGAPGFSITVPSTFSFTGNVYAAEYGTQWNSISPPATKQTSTFVIAAGNTPAQPIILNAGQTTYFSIFASDLASMQVALSAPLVIASPSNTAYVQVHPYDSQGNPIAGNLPQPVTLTDLDTSGHTSLAGSTTVSSNQPWPTVHYDGHADNFVIAANMGALRATQRFMTLLPVEQQVPGFAQAGLTYLGQPTLGPDGLFWIADANTVYKVNGAGQVVARYTNPNANIVYQGGAPVAVGSDGNLWIGGTDGSSNRGAISRVTTAGQFTNYPLPDPVHLSNQITELIAGPDSAMYFTDASAIGRVDMSGNVTQVGATDSSAPSDLTLSPAGELWFVDDVGVKRMTLAGAVTQLPITGATPGGARPSLAAGPDGDMWVPFPYGTQTLMRFAPDGTLLSAKPLSYTAPWYPLPGPLTPVTHARMISDGARYVYISDDITDALVRIDASGNLDAFPTYSTLVNIMAEFIAPVRGSDGTIYFTSTAITGPTQADQVQAFTPIAPSWQ